MSFVGLFLPLFKMAAIAYYEKPSPDGTPAHIQPNVDGTGRAVVQYTINIRKPTSNVSTITFCWSSIYKLSQLFL
jgi:hypothetical protein